MSFSDRYTGSRGCFLEHHPHHHHRSHFQLSNRPSATYSRGCTGALLSTAVTSNTTGTPDDFGRKRATTSGATDPSIKYFAVAQALFHILLAFADIKRDRRATLVARQWVLKVGPTRTEEGRGSVLGRPEACLPYVGVCRFT